MISFFALEIFVKVTVRETANGKVQIIFLHLNFLIFESPREQITLLIEFLLSIVIT